VCRAYLHCSSYSRANLGTSYRVVTAARFFAVASHHPIILTTYAFNSYSYILPGSHSYRLCVIYFLSTGNFNRGTENGSLRLCSAGEWDWLRTNQPQLTPAYLSSGLRTEKEFCEPRFVSDNQALFQLQQTPSFKPPTTTPSSELNSRSMEPICEECRRGYSYKFQNRSSWKKHLPRWREMRESCVICKVFCAAHDKWLASDVPTGNSHCLDLYCSPCEKPAHSHVLVANASSTSLPTWVLSHAEQNRSPPGLEDGAEPSSIRLG